MLIDNLKQKKIQTSSVKNESSPAKKHFPSPVREWTNSIYSFNINTMKTIPYAEALTMNIVNSYFSFYNRSIENLIKSKRTKRRVRKYSSNKIYISKGEFKHTNNKVLVNLYIFNRKKYNYILYMKKWYKKFLDKRLNRLFVKRLKVITNKLSTLMVQKNSHRDLLIKVLSIKGINLNVYMNQFFKMALKKSIKRIKRYFYYKQLLYINKSITNYSYLQILQNYIQCIFNKNVEFNLINLKRFHLNSDIFSKAITLKVARKRRKMRIYLKRVRSKINLSKIRKYSLKPSIKVNFDRKRPVNLNSYIVKKLVLKNLRYKRVTGFRIESKGRLTRRHTASRSISKMWYKGNLLDINSSRKGLSTPVLRGVIKSNLQTTKLKSKTRIGSFGIKGWISGN